jgi:ubiquinone/menaquinone biosynthesis C-methylase UbiE
LLCLKGLRVLGKPYSRTLLGLSHRSAMTGGLGPDWRRVVWGIEALGTMYPSLNRAISLGLDRALRRLAVLSAGRPSGRILDAGAGDGSLTEVIQSMAQGRPYLLVMLDPSEKMLRIAEKRVDLAASERVVGVVEHLPLAAGVIDRSYMSFSLRDVYDLDASLRSLAVVMKNSGLLTVIDLAKPDSALLAALYDLYWRLVSPFLAAMTFSRHWREIMLIHSTYRALPRESILLALLKRYFRPLIVRRLLLGGIHILVLRRVVGASLGETSGVRDSGQPLSLRSAK